jgi:lipoprotein NlpD
MKTGSIGTEGGRTLLAVVVLAALVAGCASPTYKAPVEDRKPGVRPAVSAPVPAATLPVPAAEAPAVKQPLPGAENAGKPGFYTVRPGDTLIRIGLDSGQNWRDIARWNSLENSNRIEVGQTLRVAPPVPESAGVTVRPVAPAGRVDSKPLDPARPGSAPAAATPAPGTAGPLPATSTGREGDEDINWAWPAAGSVVAGFDEAKSKGLAIGGNAGDAVLAAADGRVVYVGAGIRGYGNLVIVKHNATYLTAYAHNQTLLVKEDQAVRRGQKIAEMGSSDADRVQLHFEIRRQGKPIDPARLLPAR